MPRRRLPWRSLFFQSLGERDLLGVQIVTSVVPHTVIHGERFGEDRRVRGERKRYDGRRVLEEDTLGCQAIDVGFRYECCRSFPACPLARYRQSPTRRSSVSPMKFRGQAQPRTATAARCPTPPPRRQQQSRRATAWKKNRVPRSQGAPRGLAFAFFDSGDASWGCVVLRVARF